MPFNLGPTETILILVVLLLVFGAKRLPELGSGLGKGIREFKRSMKDIKEEVDREEPAPPQQIRNPVRAQVAPPAEENRTEREPSRSAVENQTRDWQ